ncbi:hypothetical protein RRG08_033097 [Elysia crispata]|uniref:Uncharacterized protein n=1 Tax=Elysia crispata TaxID=231223 RepID=A0AAE1BAE7_9GAST|nr:hypothetical protein RRG08_033097 [Elysia crispata]
MLNEQRRGTEGELGEFRAGLSRSISVCKLCKSERQDVARSKEIEYSIRRQDVTRSKEIEYSIRRQDVARSKEIEYSIRRQDARRSNTLSGDKMWLEVQLKIIISQEVTDFLESFPFQIAEVRGTRLAIDTRYPVAAGAQQSRYERRPSEHSRPGYGDSNTKS